MFQNLTHRRAAREEMDKPDIDKGDLENALRALMRINTVGNGVGLFWPSIRKLLEVSDSNEPLRILDVGCGGGDMSRRLETRARRAGFSLQVDGCDISPVAIAMAQRENDAAGCAGSFFVCDAISAGFREQYDVVISSLFLHHLGDDDSVRALKNMGACAKRQLLISDLVRTRLGLLLVYLATRTLSSSTVVHRDGVTSLLAAFTVPEVRALLGRAGLRGADVSLRWPERFLISWCPD